MQYAWPLFQGMDVISLYTFMKRGVNAHNSTDVILLIIHTIIGKHVN